jgi:hypothetical protein
MLGKADICNLVVVVLLVLKDETALMRRTPAVPDDGDGEVVEPRSRCCCCLGPSKTKGRMVGLLPNTINAMIPGLLMLLLFLPSKQATAP